VVCVCLCMNVCMYVCMCVCEVCMYVARGWVGSPVLMNTNDSVCTAKTLLRSGNDTGAIVYFVTVALISTTVRAYSLARCAVLHSESCTRGERRLFCARLHRRTAQYVTM